MNCAIELQGSFNRPEPAGKIRLMAGLTMMTAGFYVGWFTEIPGHGLGLLAFIASFFIFLTDEKRVVKAVQNECLIYRRSRCSDVTAAGALFTPLIETTTRQSGAALRFSVFRAKSQIK